MCDLRDATEASFESPGHQILSALGTVFHTHYPHVLESFRVYQTPLPTVSHPGAPPQRLRWAVFGLGFMDEASERSAALPEVT